MTVKMRLDKEPHKRLAEVVQWYERSVMGW